MTYMQNIQNSLICFKFLRPTQAQINDDLTQSYPYNTFNLLIITRLSTCKELARRAIITCLCFSYITFATTSTRNFSQRWTFTNNHHMTVACLIFYTGTYYFVSQCRWFTKIWILKIAIHLPTKENDVNSTYAMVLP